MKGLPRWPTPEEWSVAYDRFQLDQTPIDEAQWACFADWGRLDPRFAEIYCARLARDWSGLAAARLNSALRTQVWPAALGPLLSMVALGLGREQRAAFKLWARSAMLGIAAPHLGLYFVGTRSPGSRAALQDATATLEIYSEWGFLGRDILLNKASARLAQINRTWKRAPERMRTIDTLLDNLLASGIGRLTVDEYRAALDGGVGRRQARLDLIAHPRLRALGNTRARYFVVTPARARRRKSV